MARKFETSDIVTPNKARLRADSFTHINSSFDEMSNALVKAGLASYTTNDVIILDGCVVSGTVVSPGPAAVTAGQIFYNGRIYEVDANASITLAGAQVPVWVIVESQQGGQTTFTDGNDYDFQTIEKFVLQAGLSGSGLANYDGATVKRLTKTKIVNIGDWNMDTTGNVTVAHGLSAADWKKIKNVSATIRNDADSAYYPIDAVNNIAAPNGGIDGYDSTNITLRRTVTGDFDNAAFDSTGYNRGFVTIVYGDI